MLLDRRGAAFSEDVCQIGESIRAESNIDWAPKPKAMRWVLEKHFWLHCRGGSDWPEMVSRRRVRNEGHQRQGQKWMACLGVRHPPARREHHLLQQPWQSQSSASSCLVVGSKEESELKRAEFKITRQSESTQGNHGYTVHILRRLRCSPDKRTFKIGRPDSQKEYKPLQHTFCWELKPQSMTQTCCSLPILNHTPSALTRRERELHCHVSSGVVMRCTPDWVACGSSVLLLLSGQPVSCSTSVRKQVWVRVRFFHNTEEIVRAFLVANFGGARSTCTWGLCCLPAAGVEVSKL